MIERAYVATASSCDLDSPALAIPLPIPDYVDEKVPSYETVKDITLRVNSWAKEWAEYREHGGNLDGIEWVYMGVDDLINLCVHQQQTITELFEGVRELDKRVAYLELNEPL